MKDLRIKIYCPLCEGDINKCDSHYCPKWQPKQGDVGLPFWMSWKELQTLTPIKPTSVLITVGAGSLIEQYIKEDPIMTPMRDAVKWTLDLNYPSLRLLNGIYFSWTRISPIQVQVLLFDGFDWVLATEEHMPGEIRIGITKALKCACEALGDCDERCQQELWNDLMEE